MDKGAENPFLNLYARIIKMSLVTVGVRECTRITTPSPILFLTRERCEVHKNVEAPLRAYHVFKLRQAVCLLPARDLAQFS